MVQSLDIDLWLRNVKPRRNQHPKDEAGGSKGMEFNCTKRCGKCQILKLNSNLVLGFNLGLTGSKLGLGLGSIWMLARAESGRQGMGVNKS